MPASQTFSGNWTIKVVSSGFFARQRFIVEGSLVGQGIYPAQPRLVVSMSGPRWDLRCERGSPTGWDPSAYDESPQRLPSMSGS